MKCEPGCTCGHHRIRRCEPGCTCGKHVGPWTGKKRSEETKRKMAESRRGMAMESTRGERHWNYRGSATTYSGAHYRARRALKGRPCAFADDTCKGIMTAAMNHDAPKEFVRIAEDSTHLGFLYSIRVEDYLALCKSHHTRYDRKSKESSSS